MWLIFTNQMRIYRVEHTSEAFRRCDRNCGLQCVAIVARMIANRLLPKKMVNVRAIPESAARLQAALRRTEKVKCMVRQAANLAVPSDAATTHSASKNKHFSKLFRINSNFFLMVSRLFAHCLLTSPKAIATVPQWYRKAPESERERPSVPARERGKPTSGTQNYKITMFLRLFFSFSAPNCVQVFGPRQL